MKNDLKKPNLLTFVLKKALFLITLISICYGCNTLGKSDTLQEQVSEAVDGTISSVCEINGYENAPVQGYGLVCGLRGTGSQNCPSTLKSYILSSLREPEVRAAMGPYYRKLSLDDILKDRSTAVVQVTGTVPAGSPKGQALDVQVTVLPSTQTTSLQGGELLPCELRTVTSIGHRPVAGRAVAVANGPIFVNPFPLGEINGQPRHADPRQGRIIGGAVSLQDRQIELLLTEPSWRQASRIQNRINSRFSPPEGPNVAIGLSRSAIKIQIPEQYQNRYSHFISMLLTLYLDDDPAFLLGKLENLSNLAQESLPDADFESLCVSWEAIGKNAHLSLTDLYQNRQGRVQFYAARTALDLEDAAALEIIVRISQDSNHPNQIQAIKTLHRYTGRPTARRALLALMDGADVSMRLLAYEGLRNARDVRIEPYKVKRGFWLDKVETQGEKLLCVWTGKSPRIVLFGKSIPCRSNIFFESSNQPLTINSGAGDNELTIIRDISEGLIKVKSELNASDLIVKMSMPPRSERSEIPGGAGLSFSEIAGVLYEMCREEHAYIMAKFSLHNERSG